MDLNVTVLNILRYNDKNTNEPKIRIGYINNDSKYIENTDKFRGYPELSVFFDDNGLWEKLDLKLVGQIVKFTFAKEVNPRNPLKDITKLTKITCEKANVNIDIL